MSISKIDLEKLNKPYRFHIVHYENETYRTLGLEPLYLTSYPQYINLRWNVFYGGLTHYECNLVHDVIKMLEIMNSNVYDRFGPVCVFLNDDYPIHFCIYNNQIFLNDEMSLSVYKNNLNIRN